MMVQKRFYNIEEISIILGKSISAIHGHLARKQFTAVPPPIKLGRRLAWLVESVDLWIQEKSQEAQLLQQNELKTTAPSASIGRPNKTQARAKRMANASSTSKKAC